MTARHIVYVYKNKKVLEAEQVFVLAATSDGKVSKNELPRQEKKSRNP